MLGNPQKNVGFLGSWIVDNVCGYILYVYICNYISIYNILQQGDKAVEESTQQFDSYCLVDGDRTMITTSKCL